MGKKKGWFGFLKRIFVCNVESLEEKRKRRRWCFRMLRINRRYQALETPEAKIKDRKEDQKQHKLALAVAMTAAAEAAVAAANAAAELARLVSFPEELDRRTRNLAAIKIQSFYRAHLARKALAGLRGVVKLQALIRGQIVRQKFLKRIQNTQMFESTRSRVHQIRIPTFIQISKICNDKQDLCSTQKTRSNDHNLEDSTAIRSHRFEEYTSIKSGQTCETQKKLRFQHKHGTEKHNSPSFRSQSSYSGKRHSHLSSDRSDNTSLPNSPSFPAYMATTESFMAKARSLSTPRQRLSFLDGYCTHGSTSGMPMLSSSSSFNGGMKGDYKHIHL